MIRTSTVVYIVLLLILVGAYFFLKNRETPAELEPTLEPTQEVSYVYSADQGNPSSIRLEAQSGESVELALGDDDSWVLKEPLEAPAEQAAAGAAVSQIVAMQIVDPEPGVQPKDAGLAPPQYVLTLRFSGGDEETLEIGNPTPSGTGYYARKAGGEVLIVSRNAVDPLLDLLQFPPYLETPTPDAASDSGTGTPAPVTATP